MIYTANLLVDLQQVQDLLQSAVIGFVAMHQSMSIDLMVGMPFWRTTQIVSGVTDGWGKRDLQI